MITRMMTVKTSSTTSQPTATWPSGESSELPVLEHAHQHDGARDRQRHAEDEPVLIGNAERREQHHAQQRRDEALADRAGDRDSLDRQQVLDVEVQPDAEHQQDHADFRELLRDLHVADEARAWTGRSRRPRAGSRRSARARAAG